MFILVCRSFFLSIYPSLFLSLRNHSLQFNLATLVRLISHEVSILVEHEKKLEYKKKSMKYNRILL